MSFPRYSKYKTSGVEWLGQLPVDWGVVPLKAGFELKRRPPPESCGVVTAFRDGEVTLRSNRRIDGFTEAIKEIGYQGVEPNDLVIHAMDAFAGAIGVSDSKGKSTPVYLVCEPKQEYFSKFYGLVLRHIALTGFITSLAKGIRERSTDFRWSDAKNITIPHPSFVEQKLIIKFLDYETAKIDELVAEQERLIELLKEKRQAVISHAVTKGLNPDAPMKDSGIEWLGDVPLGWEVTRLKNLVDEPLKYGANEAAELDDRTLPRFVRITDIDDTGGLREETFKSLPVEIADPFLLREGDVLLARSGATVGKSFIYSIQWGTACFAGYLIRARLRHTTCLAKWLYYFCQTSGYWGYVVGSQIQATIQNVSAEKYANLYLAVPTIDEQIATIAFMDHETAKFTTLTTEANRVIDLLKERRIALISAAVTGQIDVRNLVSIESA